MSTSLWRNRDFRLLISGRTVSQFGTAMSTFVIPWLFLQMTGSGAQTGIAFAVGFIPYIVVSLPAGVWADRWNRKGLMMMADAVRLVTLLSIPLVHLISGALPLGLLYGVQAVISAFSAVFDAAYGACLPSIVPAEALREANNTLQTSMSMSKILGPILAGVAVSFIGSANTLLVDVGSYIISIVSLWAIVRPFSARPKLERRATFTEELREGMVTVWALRPIRYLMLFSMFVNLVGPGMDVALLYRVQHELVLRSQWAGIIMTGLSGGMLLGSLVNRWVGKRLDLSRWLTLSSILQVFPPIVLSMTKNPFIISGIQVFIGVLLVAWNVQTVTLRQTLIPNHLLGRSSSVFRLSAWVFIPLGDGIAGTVSEFRGTRLYFIGAAVVLFIVSLLCVRMTSKVSLLPETETSHSITSFKRL